MANVKVFVDKQTDKLKLGMGKGRKLKFGMGKGRKHFGKRRKCWLTAFSPFPTKFSKGYFLRVVKSQDCVAKS